MEEPTTTTPPPKAEAPFPLTIRFTTSLPDLDLDIPLPSRTTIITLKSLIRAALPPSHSPNRLRLIYSGRLLPDASLLTTVLKPPPPPPPQADRKGKAPVQPTQRIYINCSIGDALSAEDLASEASSARAPSPAAPVAAPTTTAAQPRGFDRLLTSSFTPAEVGALRLQFMAVQASMHTPDTMPSPTTLRRMEDAWLDDNGSGGGVAEVEAAGGALDDLLWGHVMGFLWPLGALGWLGREDWAWSERRRMAVWSGVVLGMGFGLMRMMG
ncbi:hypothetical protein V499_06165 [Pseudogymnoascus sp. VKM F-103]|uniref:Ubiquitin-like domain-containing protein n=1 Tax=Pseudogymnoascus verrucosus TaxID=342668 RepID=A0A1B8GG86_9PEZI|nr:uncharacterized protein VE01_06317 [Pseudogymnoascus verrucosus]KFY73774.1 hypothetical protein V499_06165 [Pseudogymnoascus sp. VKM F-103]OBT94835.1 hypothetical protein VE01_06317 [Pseudogymnoascus verrucosus]